MNDVQIRCFLKAAELNNFTQAANSLFIAQPALSRNIAALESELGVQLFTRERKSVHLSEAGEICYNGFLKIENELESLRSRAKAAQRNQNGELIIGCANGLLIGESYGNVFNHLFRDYPNISVKLEFCSLNEMKKKLSSGAVDLLIIAHSEVQDLPEIATQVVRHCRACLVVPANHPYISRENLSINDFKGEIFLTLDKSESETVLNRESKMRKYGTDLQFRTAPDIGTLALWLESGLGITTLAEWHMLRNSPKLKFLQIPNAEQITEVAAWMTQNSNPAIYIFLDMLQRYPLE